MPEEHKIRYGWLKAMYIYTIVGAGGFGLGIIVMPTITYIIGDLIAIPFSYVFSKETEVVTEQVVV